MDQNTTQKNSARTLYLSLLLVLLALVSVTAASVAWFTIADNTRLHSISMDVSAGPAIRFDLDPHDDITQYKKTLTFDEIADRLRADWGYDMRDKPLEPVTTQDCVEFTFRNGTVVSADSGSYLEFTLHFMSAQDVLVHLTPENSEGKADGTLVSSKTAPALPAAMRISFTARGETVVYDPGSNDGTGDPHAFRRIFLPDAGRMVYSAGTVLFSLQKDVDLPVVVRVWMEGTDPVCENSLQGADYSIRLRFLGTNEDHQPIKTG